MYFTRWDRDVQLPIRKADVDSLNGLVVFDSGGEDAAETNSSSPDLQEIAAKQIKTIHRHKRHRKAKAIVDSNFLCRKTSKRTSTILTNSLILETQLNSMFKTTVYEQTDGGEQAF